MATEWHGNDKDSWTDIRHTGKLTGDKIKTERVAK